MNLIDTLTYQPVEIGFGTSGLRALVIDMTDLECYINALGFLRFLMSKDSLAAGSKVYVAGDLRDSTPHIMQVVCEACYAAGLVPVNIGKIPTPAAAYYALYENAPCIVVTGSHIPNDRNGIKFYKRAGEVLKEDEASIQSEVSKARQEIYCHEAEDSVFANTGDLTSLAELPSLLKDAEEAYVSRYTGIFPGDCLKGKQIIVYQHSAVGRDIIVRILEALGATVIAVERSDTFISIDTENVTKADQVRFTEFAVQHPNCFAIVSTDGDSDRPFVIDETGVFHRGDILGAVVAEFLRAKFAAVPISSNDAVDTFCSAKGINLEHTKIGSPYVIVAMNKATHDKHPAVAWEVNGGFLTGDDIYVQGTLLKALPTRDAVLPILCSLIAATQSNQKISELFSVLPSRYTAGSLIDDVDPVKIAQFKKDCNDPDKIESIMHQVFQNTDLGNLTRLDHTDGLRLIFESGDIVHLRPSGNAPQFRVYTNAFTKIRAHELAEKAVAANGYINKLLSIYTS